MRILYVVLTLAVLAGCSIAPIPAGSSEDIFVPPASGLSAGDALLVAVARSAPLYPKEIFDKEVSGDATVDFIVERDGSVRIAKAVLQTNELFGAAAVDCVKQWRFKPALKNGVPVRFGSSRNGVGMRAAEKRHGHLS
jgi:protein TonB